MKIVHIYNQGLDHDIRTRRYGQALTDSFKEIEYLLIGQRLNKRDQSIEILSDRSRIIRLYFSFFPKRLSYLKIVNFTLWMFGVFLYVWNQKQVKVISAHSLKVLPVCVILSTLKGSKLIYDTHEIETHTTNNKVLIFLLSLVEKICVQSIDQIIVTSPGHYRWYIEKYKVSVLLIRNCPSIKEKHKIGLNKEYDLKKLLGLTEKDFLYIYIGVINVSRGLNVLLDSFKNCNKRNHILFLGFGDVKPILDISVVYSNIHFMNPVPPLELIKYISTADVGLHMMDSSNLNHRMALPNKPMQYMAAGLPCIVSDVEVMADLIFHANSGWIVEEGNSNALTNLINSINMKDIEKYASCADLWFESNNWELESTQLIQLYSHLLNIYI